MNDFSRIQAREAGLSRRLTSRQLGMIALGGAIGTGLFLGSKNAIGLAGPSVVVSYAIGGLIALLLMGCLAEMTVAHSTSGSFGAYAEHYIGPLAGFLTRYLYWSCIVLAVGTEVTAIGEYMQYWFPSVPPWVWVIVFAGALIAVNALNVKAFGTLEYWLSSVKVFAIIAFIVFCLYLVIGGEGPGAATVIAEDGGFFAGGFSGLWFAVIFSIFSYLSIEMIAVAAGEAERPAEAVRKAFRSTIVRLVLFYLVTLSLIVVLVPVTSIVAGGSPFVTVMEQVGIPFAPGILNFVVIIAALSAMNSQLYTATRMAFSLSRSGDAPAFVGAVRANGSPVNALLISCTGIAVATVVYVLFPDQAFTMMIALSSFGAMCTWLLIFVTHWFFRRRVRAEGTHLDFRMPWFPLGTLLGAALMLAILLSTPLAPGFEPTLLFGVPFVALLVLFYAMTRRRRAARRAIIDTQSIRVVRREARTEDDPVH